MDLFCLAAPMFAGALYMLASSARYAAAGAAHNPRAAELRLTIGLVLLIAAGWACIVGGCAAMPGAGFEFDLP